MCDRAENTGRSRGIRCTGYVHAKEKGGSPEVTRVREMIRLTPGGVYYAARTTGPGSMYRPAPIIQLPSTSVT
jgi:hypothetical protein